MCFYGCLTIAFGKCLTGSQRTTVILHILTAESGSSVMKHSLGMNLCLGPSHATRFLPVGRDETSLRNLFDTAEELVAHIAAALVVISETWHILTYKKSLVS